MTTVTTLTVFQVKHIQRGLLEKIWKSDWDHSLSFRSLTHLSCIFVCFCALRIHNFYSCISCLPHLLLKAKLVWIMEKRADICFHVTQSEKYGNKMILFHFICSQMWFFMSCFEKWDMYYKQKMLEINFMFQGWVNIGN